MIIQRLHEASQEFTHEACEGYPREGILSSPQHLLMISLHVTRSHLKHRERPTLHIMNSEIGTCPITAVSLIEIMYLHALFHDFF